MNTATVTVTTGSAPRTAVLSRSTVEFEGRLDRFTARQIARASAETVKGQSVSVSADGATYRFTHSEVSK